MRASEDPKHQDDDHDDDDQADDADTGTESKCWDCKFHSF
jgi:hypothetical protein